MSWRLVAIAVISLAAIACASGQSLSPPSSWGSDFTDRSPPTDACPGGTLSHLRTRMTISEPSDLATLRQLIPDKILPMLTQDDRLHRFQFSTDPDSGDFWGFSGYLVARGDCIVYVSAMGYDN